MWFIDKCKCCLKDGDMRDMWSEYVNDGQVEVYGDMLASCFALPGTDRTEYMEKICEVCVEKLRAANEFRQEVITSKEVLDKLIEESKDLKVEFVEADEEECQDPEYEQHESLGSFEFLESLHGDSQEENEENEEMQVEYLEDDIEAKRYKVVKIIERGKFSWIAVPAFWENKYKVQIPLTNRIELIKSYAKPKDDWRTTNCKVVKKVKNLKEAEKVIRMILARKVAKRLAGDPLKLDKRLSRINNKDRTKPQETTHDLASVQSLVTIDFEKEYPEENEPSNKDTNDEVTALNNNTTPNFRTGDDKEKTSKEQPKKENDLNAKIDKISSQISAVIENQKVLSANQETMSLNMLKQNLMLESFIKSFHSQEIVYHPPSDEFQPISSEEELCDFERKLKDPEYKMELKKKFSVLFGKGPGKGANNAYRFVDILFAREFLPFCSWSGGSRGEEVKVCFKAYRNVLNFFFSFINSTDELYTMEDCETFFKVVLKNSKKRLHVGMRQSSSRHRIKKIKTSFIDGGELDD